MTITLDTATIGLIIVLLLNLLAGVRFLFRQEQVLKNHDDYHKAHREDIRQLDNTQREHGKTLAIHASILERRHES